MAKNNNAVVGINELAAKMQAEMGEGWTLDHCKSAISAFTAATLKLCKGDVGVPPVTVRVVGFGIFSNEFVEAHEATNPQNPTGPKLQIPAKNVFKIKAAKGIDMTPPAPAAPARRRR